MFVRTVLLLLYQQLPINGITGTWSPAVSTAAPGTTTYTFTPDAGQCATTTTLSITVDPTGNTNLYSGG